MFIWYFIVFLYGIVIGSFLYDRKCKTLCSHKYPIMELANGGLYLMIFAVNGWNLVSVLYCLMASALLTLSVIDFHTYKIPFNYNLFIACLGVFRVCMERENWKEYVIGFFAVSLLLELLLILSQGRAIGGGDVKLMAAAGLVIGWKLIILAFYIGCILSLLIHLIRIKVSHADHMLAMGPYLSMGILIAALYGTSIIDWYLRLPF